MVCFYLLNVMVSIMTAVYLRAAKNSMLSPLSLKSGRSQIFFKMGVPKNFAIFTVKHLCWSLFLIKLQKACNCIKKRRQHSCFSVNIAKYLRAACFCSLSLIHLMRTIARAHASKDATSLMNVKNSTCHFYLLYLFSGTLE